MGVGGNLSHETAGKGIPNFCARIDTDPELTLDLHVHGTHLKKQRKGRTRKVHHTVSHLPTKPCVVCARALQIALTEPPPPGRPTLPGLSAQRKESTKNINILQGVLNNTAIFKVFRKYPEST